MQGICMSWNVFLKFLKFRFSWNKKLFLILFMVAFHFSSNTHSMYLPSVSLQSLFYIEISLLLSESTLGPMDFPQRL